MEAKFLYNNTTYRTTLNELEVFQLEKYGKRFTIDRLREKVWTSLKLKGESVTLRELKFQGFN